MSQTRQSRPLSVAMGTATFVANDDIAACVDVLHVRRAGGYLVHCRFRPSRKCCTGVSKGTCHVLATCW